MKTILKIYLVFINFIEKYKINVAIPFIITVMALSLALITQPPIIIKNFYRVFFENEYLYSKLFKVRTKYTIQSIEDILESKVKIKNTGQKCDSHYFIEDQYIMEVRTNKTGGAVGYSVVSLKPDFNPRVNFYTDQDFKPKELRLNKDTFSYAVNKSLKAEYFIGERGDQGFYSELFSVLGGTTNGYSGGILTNLNYVDPNLQNEWQKIILSNFVNKERDPKINNLPFNGFWIIETGVCDSNIMATGNYTDKEII